MAWVLSAGAFLINLDARVVVPLLRSVAEELATSALTAGYAGTAALGAAIDVRGCQAVLGVLAGGTTAFAAEGWAAPRRPFSRV